MLARAVSGLPRAYCTSRCERTSLGRAVWPAISIFICTPPWHHNEAKVSSQTTRHASTTSSTRWKARQSRDHYAQDAKLAGLKSRAAFKLLEINAKHRIFHRGDTVVDLGYAPGSWSQVAISQTAPGGRVVGIDIIPTQPPRGVSTIQGNFLSPEVRGEVKRFVQEPMRGRVRERGQLSRSDEDESGLTEEELEEQSKGLIERERGGSREIVIDIPQRDSDAVNTKQLDRAEGRVVNVVLSDMSEPWPLTTSTWIKSVSNPYRRMLNTSGNAARDHGGSMDLCNAALIFCYDTLVTGGHFICKYYQGAEDKALESSLKALFEKVHRIKPDSSRKESREAYFVCLRRRAGVHRDTVFDDDG